MNKVAVLIAAGSGIGANAAKVLSKAGYKIAIFSSSEKSKKLAKELNKIFLKVCVFFRLKILWSNKICGQNFAESLAKIALSLMQSVRPSSFHTSNSTVRACQCLCRTVHRAIAAGSCRFRPRKKI